jgi:hypothetical protein
MPAETIGERIRHLDIGISESKVVPRWPPDVFAVCASLLMCSGAYSLVVDDKPIQGDPKASSDRAKLLEDCGERWRKVAASSVPVPKEVQYWWDIIFNNRDLSISRLPRKRIVCEALLNLLAAADEASYEVGIYFPYSESSIRKGSSGDSDAFASKAEMRLLDTLREEQGSTLCLAIHQSRARVLPKMHTPQSGLTVRSLSHHLAFCVAPDIAPQWLSAGVEVDDHTFNILVVPWPGTINPSQFRSSRKVQVTDQVEGGSYGLFTYTADRGPSASFVEGLIADAVKRIGPVHAVVFPELSMSEAEFDRLATSIGKDRFLVAGIGKAATGSFKSGQNEVVLHVRVPFGDAKVYTRFHQRKHHRWKLTKSQILQYGLGQNLHPGVNWWEHIMLGHRTLSFITLREWLTTSVLICEDLARPDPMGDILRAVGPNLIIALLCDAPQLIGRWPGRYAGAFADDPGASVLTLTSAGMANLSQPQPGRENKCRTIALWRDAKTDAKEIDLPLGSDAVLLNLAVEYHEEWTADGRSDGGFSGYPVLVAHHPIYRQKSPKPAKATTKRASMSSKTRQA